MKTRIMPLLTVHSLHWHSSTAVGTLYCFGNRWVTNFSVCSNPTSSNMAFMDPEKWR